MPITLYDSAGYIAVASAKPADRPAIQARARPGHLLTVCGCAWSHLRTAEATGCESLVMAVRFHAAGPDVTPGPAFNG